MTKPMIGTLPRGIGSVLDAPDLDPFWKAADETGAVIHIHPAFDAGEVRVNDFGLANGAGRVTDAIVAQHVLIIEYNGSHEDDQQRKSEFDFYRHRCILPTITTCSPRAG